MLLNLILLFLFPVYTNQEKHIGHIERLSPEINKLIELDTKIEILAEGFEWSEGPIWSKSLNSILFSDVPNNVIYKWNEKNGLSVFSKPIGYTGKVPNLKRAGTNGLTIDSEGNLIICMHGDRMIAKMENLNIKHLSHMVYKLSDVGKFSYKTVFENQEFYENLTYIREELDKYIIMKGSSLADLNKPYQQMPRGHPCLETHIEFGTKLAEYF